MTEAIRVRPADEADVAPIVELTVAVAAERVWIGTEPGFDQTQRAEGTRAIIRGDTPGVTLVAEAGGAVIGVTGLIVARYGVADLGMLVADGWRGRGVGTALLEAAIDWARDRHDVHKVALQHWPHNEAAHRLYASHGFEVEGRLRRHYRRENGEAWDAIVMGLLVDPSIPGSSISSDPPSMAPAAPASGS